MIPLTNLHINNDVVDNYKTVLLTNIDSLDNNTELKENAEHLRMMFVAEGSTSGNLVTRLFLSSIGISSPGSQFNEVQFGGNHISTFEKLLHSETDLCAIGSNEYFKQIRADSTLKDKVKLLWLSDEIPLGPVLINNKFSLEERDIISNLLLNLHRENS